MSPSKYKLMIFIEGFGVAENFFESYFSVEYFKKYYKKDIVNLIDC